MFEIVIFFLLVSVIVAWYRFPSFFKFFKTSAIAESSAASSKLKIPEDSMLRRHFMTQLQSEIESALLPRPTDSVLQRHYDTLVAAELNNRLA